ncbi:MAG: ABC transporter permease [Candidatus Hydrogenedentes bacterium]|nr:ABC transporter permease [Candidatus Hydrogenedentota bacterium]
MVSYIARRLIMAVPVVLGVATIVFVLMFLIPGDPVRLMMGQRSDPALEAQIRAEMGLDKPVAVQYIRFMGRIVRGDLGYSLSKRRKVTDILLERLPATIYLGLTSLIIAVLIGVPAGIIAAVRQNKFTDGAVMTISLLGVSTPVFWLALMMIIVFAVKLGWFPVSGYGDGGIDLRHLTLPAVSLSAISVGYIARITRSSMLEVLKQDYMRTARAKGARGSAVVLKHGLKNALIPVVTVIGVNFANVLGGAVATETVFAWPGVGRAMIDALRVRDIPMIEGGVILLATAFVLANLAVDVMYSFLDPRVRLE